MSAVKVIIDGEDEMLSISVNDSSVFFGNFWDFSRPGSIIDLLRSIPEVSLEILEQSIEV